MGGLKSSAAELISAAGMSNMLSVEPEDEMNDKLFDSPVFVKGGSLTIVEIASLRDAIDFLEEWPIELQDVPYETILRACYSALDGNHPLSTARDNFARWARDANILEDLPSVPAWMTGPKSGPGGVLA
jgi:hypothetical protein